MATNETLTELDSLPLPAEGTDLLYVVRSNTSYKATVADLPSTGGGVTIIGTIDSETKSANGAVINGTDIVMQTADTTNVGLVELATDAETQALTSTDKVVTPSNLNALTASTTQKGLVTRATTAEQQAGEDTAKYSTPETVAEAYNAYAPTVITSSSTLTTSISMIIATGAGGYATTLPDAATFPASQLGKPIYYVNNSGAANTIGVETGGFTSVTLSITGATTTPPLYALSSTTLPTVTSMTIAGNVATATANSASAQTFDYVTSNNILQVTPKMTFTNGNVLSIDPTSTTGSTKFNYSVNNTVQVGSKIQVDVGGTVSEITVAAGSQTSNAVFDSSWGQLSYADVNDGSLIAVGTSNRKLARSTDGGNTWLYLATLGGSGAVSGVAGACYFLGKMYIGLIYTTNQSTINLWSSSDLVTWNSAHSQTFTNAGSCGVATDGTTLSILYGDYNGAGLSSTRDIYPFSSTNGTSFTQGATQSFTAAQFGASAILLEYRYLSSRFVASAYRGALSSTDGINFIKYQSGLDSYVISINYFNSLFIIAMQDNTDFTIYSSPDLATWTSRQTIAGATYWGRIVASGSLLTLPVYNSTTVCTSSNGTTWSSNTATSAAFSAYSGAYNNGKFIYGKLSTREIWTSATGTSGWTSVNLDTSTFQFTMTSPSIAAPAWAGLGGQTEQYSVSATSTPSFTAATSPVYTRSTNDITITYAAVTPSAYTHLQLKALTMNSGDILKQIGADLHIDADFDITIPVGGKDALIPTSTAGWQSFQFAG